MTRISALLIPFFALAVVGCKPPPAPQKDAAKSAPLIIAAEDVLTIRNNALSSGPAITGSIQPERKADVRAEVPTTVLRVLKERSAAATCSCSSTIRRCATRLPRRTPRAAPRARHSSRHSASTSE